MKKLLLAISACLLTTMAWAQTYPAKTIEFIVGNAPGGTSDIFARAMAASMSRSLGQPVVVLNKAGAGGSIAMKDLIAARPDGYTIALGSVSTLGVSPNCSDPLPYDPTRDITPVTIFARVPNILAVHPSFPAQNFGDFIKEVRANPGKYNYGAQGCTHLQMIVEQMKLKTNTNLVNIPYKSSVQVKTAAIMNEVQVITDTTVLLQQITAGQLRPIAVTWNSRMPELPNVPTLSELGVPEANITNWYGIIAPANLPQDIIERLNRAVRDSLNDPDVIKVIRSNNGTLENSGTQEFAREISAEFNKHRSAIRSGRIKISN